MDDQEVDPIAEALSAVSAQFAGERSQPDAADALDAASLPYDDEEDFAGDAPSDDPNADADDSSDELQAESDEPAAPTVNWDDESNPYRTQAIQQAQELQKHNLARDLFQRIQARQQAQAEEESAQELIAQLQEVDPQLAETYSGQRQGLIQRTAQAQQETAGWQRGMAALVLAIQEELGDEALGRVRALGQELAKHPNFDGMQQFVQTRKQATTNADKRVAELEDVVRQLLLQQGAKSRPAAADRVDSAPAARPKATRPEDADDMDGFFAAWQPDLDAHFGRR